ncbi:MAG: [protein-PII] uridylyltransferase [Gammaproteobacteria bacterium]|nr:[protein-PII] uridylyltransferase [Gammaproteobacteria bacterium]
MQDINIPEVLKRRSLPARFADIQARKRLSVAQYREFISATRKAQRENFDPHADIYELIALNTYMADELLRNLWQQCQVSNHMAALVAVGGYGRRELFPGSDIDIMILLDKGCDEQTKQKVKTFLTLLWDIKLPVAQSVRTLKECVSEARMDVTVMTCLMEHGYLSGNRQLYDRFVTLIHSNKVWPSKKYFNAKTAELESRRHKFGDTANHLEPNVKENPGSLRDLHTLRWLTNRHFKTGSFEELMDKNFLTGSELLALQEAYITLARVRYALHLHTGRGEDRLLFDYQHGVASLLGFDNPQRNLQVEAFMQVFYRTTNQLSNLAEIIVKRLRSNIFPSLLRRRARLIDECFQIRGSQLEARSANIFKQDPSAILKLFRLLQQHSQLSGPSDGLIQLLLDHLDLIDDTFRHNDDNRKLFIAILNHPITNGREVRRMAQLGVLGRYWPSFDAVTGRMQFDLYHVYTVEEHTLRVFENTCRFGAPSSGDELDTYHDVFTQTPKALILYLAALFHDIAKGRGGDHSEMGAKDARTFCLDHHLSTFDANLVGWLVENHLVMSKTAQHSDTNDPGVLKDFAENVGNLVRLHYLYLLTIADIRGTNPKLWDSWRSTLLADLYQNTSQFLHHGLDSPVEPKELIQEVKASALQHLDRQGIARDRCLTFWEELEEDYFLRHSDDEVARQASAIFEHGSDGEVVVNIHQYSARGATEIFIYCNDRNYLFAHITSALSKLGLTIVHARIITSRKGHALDTFLVLGEDGGPISDTDQCRQLADKLAAVLKHPSRISISVSQDLPRKIREMQVPIRTQYEHSPNHDYTTMDLKAPDFPGLLASLGNAFMDCNISIHNAQISKLGERVHNIFQISTLDNQPLDPSQQQGLDHAIRQCLQ